MSNYTQNNADLDLIKKWEILYFGRRKARSPSFFVCALAKFNSGLILCRDSSGKLLGYIDFWPITECAFLDLSSYKRKEYTVTCNDILQPHVSFECKYWYIGGLAVSPDILGSQISTNVILRLLSNLMSLLSDNINSYPSKVIAFSSSVKGELVCINFGMRKLIHAPESPCFHNDAFIKCIETPLHISDFRHWRK